MTDDPKPPETPPTAAADKPAGTTPAEPLIGEVSRTDAPGAGVSAAHAAEPASPPPADKTPPAFIATLQAAVPGGVAALSYWVGDWTIISPAAQILDVARHLRDAPDAAFDLLSDLTATDWPPRKDGRFDVVY